MSSTSSQSNLSASRSASPRPSTPSSSLPDGSSYRSEVGDSDIKFLPTHNEDNPTVQELFGMRQMVCEWAINDHLDENPSVELTDDQIEAMLKPYTDAFLTEDTHRARFGSGSEAEWLNSVHQEISDLRHYVGCYKRRREDRVLEACFMGESVLTLKDGPPLGSLVSTSV